MTRGRRFWFAMIVGLGGLAALLSLGVWQLGRHFSESERIAAIERGLAQPPVPTTGEETPEAANYRHVTATGAFDVATAPVRVLSSSKWDGPGHRLIAPFTLANGARILVDMGYAPEALSGAIGAPAGERTLLGYLRWPNEIGGFTPEPDLAARLFFARDVDGLAALLETAPVLLVVGAPVAEATRDAVWPRPQPIRVEARVDHRGYAITWFALAAIWGGMTGLLLLRRTA